MLSQVRGMAGLWSVAGQRLLSCSQSDSRHCAETQAIKMGFARRLAPLSEGRVEKDGTLQCAYHGWVERAGWQCPGDPHQGQHWITGRGRS